MKTQSINEELVILLFEYGIPMETNLNIDYITIFKTTYRFQFFWITS